MSNTKQLKAGVRLSYLTLALSNIIALVYTPFMLRLMGQSEYGLYSLVESVVAYLTILDFGFGNEIIRYTSKYLKVKFEDGTEYQAIEYRNFYGIIADKIIVDDILTPEEYMRVMTYAKEHNNG